MSQTNDYDFRRILEEMRSEYWRSLEEADDELGEETEELVIARIGRDRFGFGASSCREVLKLPKLVKVPRAGREIVGIINLRGEIIAVTDLRYMLAQEPLPGLTTEKLIVASGAGLTTALLVDRVEGIKAFKVSDIEAFTEGLSGVPRDVVKGQIVADDGVIVLLDLEKILSRPEFITDQKRE